MRNVKYLAGKTNTAAALDLLRTQMFQSSNGARNFASKVAIMVTDGMKFVSYFGLNIFYSPQDLIKDQQERKAKFGPLCFIFYRSKPKFDVIVGYFLSLHFHVLCRTVKVTSGAL